MTLTNVGNVNLSITLIAIPGANANEFSQTNTCPPLLKPNDGCNISVTFTPAAPGNASASLSVTDNAPGSPQSVALSGAAPGIGLMIPPGASSETVAVGNVANYALSVGGAGWSGSASLTCTGPSRYCL